MMLELLYKKSDPRSRSFGGHKRGQGTGLGLPTHFLTRKYTNLQHAAALSTFSPFRGLTVEMLLVASAHKEPT